MKRTGASGSMTLLAEHDELGERELRHIRLEASSEGKAVVLVEVDTRKHGAPRETRYEITPAELIALIRLKATEPVA